MIGPTVPASGNHRTDEKNFRGHTHRMTGGRATPALTYAMAVVGAELDCAEVT
ncbi:hypothetical protein ABII15_35560 [Streptomyces sp. HUAS MG91]|uniref:Uncharacterized protein n=1 Tax=Streptomyces tabacisoli TaxID=3156398 RepID=A0AAU8J3C7_9ACTN